MINNIKHDKHEWLNIIGLFLVIRRILRTPGRTPIVSAIGLKLGLVHELSNLESFAARSLCLAEQVVVSTLVGASCPLAEPLSETFWLTLVDWRAPLTVTPLLQFPSDSILTRTCCEFLLCWWTSRTRHFNIKSFRSDATDWPLLNNLFISKNTEQNLTPAVTRHC